MNVAWTTLLECLLLTATLVVALVGFTQRRAALAGLGLALAAIATLASNPLVLGPAVGLSPHPFLPVAAAGCLLLAAIAVAATLSRQSAELARSQQDSKESHRAEERLRRLFEATSAAYVLYDEQGIIIDANPAATALLGETLENIRSRPVEELGVLSTEDIEKLSKRRQHLLGGQPTEPTRFEIQRKDGSQRVVEFRGYPVTIAGESMILGMGHDATEQLASEDQRRQTETRLRLLAERSPAVLWTTDRELRFTSAAGSALDRLAPPRFGTKNPTITEVCAKVGIDGAPLAAHQEALSGTAVNFTACAAGVSLRAHVEPLRDQNDKICGVIGVAVDVSGQEHAEAELRQLNAELEDRVAQRTQQLQRAVNELADFSYAVSHDLRSPLRTLAGFSEALAEDAASRLNADDLHWLNRIRRAAKRMDTMIDAMLRLARLSRTEPNRQHLDLTRMAKEIASKLDRADPERATQWIIEDNLQAYADEPLTRVLFENLLSNAWKFTAETEQPKIEVSLIPDKDGVPSYRVRDNGMGFDASAENKVFRPFQGVDNEEEFDGTGLGLATASRIVARHGGSIIVESKLGRGSSFTFTLGYSPYTGVEHETGRNDEAASGLLQ